MATHYIKAYDIDGWRLDVSDEISHDFWRKFRKAVKSIKSDVVIIGENWHDANSNLRGDQYDSIMNYAFTKVCLDYFANETIDSQQMAWRLNGLLMRNTDMVNNMMLNLLDSHDTHRFFKEVNSNPKKMKSALALLYLFKGAPNIFYGTETLIWGGYDPDCRRCMNWEDTGASGKYGDIWTLLTTLSKVRQQYDLADGTIRIYEKDEKFYYENVTKQGTIILCISNAGEDFSLKVNGGTIINV